MKKKIITWFLLIICVLIISGCNSKQVENNNTLEKITDNNEVIKEVKIMINDNLYIINLEDNETTRVFVNLLPLEMEMKELNGNEKYIYLDKTLPTNSFNPQHINRGDVMLYGNNCLVIFYESFDTSYSYTKIGHIDNLTNLGDGSIKVKIEK